MCGLFGFSKYGEEIHNLSDLTNSLAREAAQRGTDATGIAYCNAGRINVLKSSNAAYDVKFKHDDLTALIGHTRHSTQGSQKKNYNNHPFYGSCKNARFALAHNGVLINDCTLKREMHLPKTKIETDSYVAVQLIEHKQKLDFGSIKFMAEKVHGSFSFSILDDADNVYLVKGDSPLSILHFPKQKIYVYASTEEILYRALVSSPLFKAIKNHEFKEVEISDGEILKIRPDGRIKKVTFEYSDYCGPSWYDYGFSDSKEYIRDLKNAAAIEGYSPEVIDELLCHGFTPEEIEDYIYCQYGGEV